MEKIMMLQSATPKQTRQFQRADGQNGVIEFYGVVLTDGINSFYGETSENLTKLISPDGQQGLRLKEGGWYVVRFNMRVREAKKEGRTGFFTSIGVHEMMRVV